MSPFLAIGVVLVAAFLIGFVCLLKTITSSYPGNPETPESMQEPDVKLSVADKQSRYADRSLPPVPGVQRDGRACHPFRVYDDACARSLAVVDARNLAEHDRRLAAADAEAAAAYADCEKKIIAIAEARFTEKTLNLDVDPGVEARALHRIVRSMHDGHCPACGHIAPSEVFNLSLTPTKPRGYKCPRCEFGMTGEEAEDALAQFRPFLQESVDLFNRWRDKRAQRNQASLAAVPVRGAH